MNYTPEIESTHWAAIEPFVSSVIADADGLTPYRSRDLQVSVSRLTWWAWKSAGLPLERDVLLRREVIARYIEVGCPTMKLAARGNARSQLLRVAEALLDTRRAPARLKPLPASDPARPYSSQEMSALLSWAEHQSTGDRRQNAHVLLALGAGAGLSTSEIGQLRVEQIDVTSDGVTVSIAAGRVRKGRQEDSLPSAPTTRSCIRISSRISWTAATLATCAHTHSACDRPGWFVNSTLGPL
jgi:integrase